MNTITWNYVKPLINNNAIEEFEKTTSVSLPSDLRETISVYNGGRPSHRYYDLESDEDKEFKTLLSFNREDIESVYKFYPIDSNDKTLIPFASDPAGNLFVVKNSKILLWNHETNICTFISNSFTDFLSMLHD